MVRIKNRYVVVKIIPKTQRKFLFIKDFHLAKSILDAVKKYYGQYGLGIVEHGFRVKYCNESTKIAIVRCVHKSYHYITSILPLITLIGDVHSKFHIIYTGATIMQCNKFVVRHQRQFLDRLLGSTESAKERKCLIKRVMEFELDK